MRRGILRTVPEAHLVVSTTARDGWIYAPPGAAQADGHPIDVASANQAATNAIRARCARRPRAPLLVVPGFTPVDTTTPRRMTETTIQRLVAAKAALAPRRALGILVSGGNVHPRGTPFNEAWGMREWLLANGVAADRIVIDPYARHSTTNIRNAGRFLLALGLHEAVIVTDLGQGFYFGAQDLSTFRLRCLAELGYSLGALEPDPGFTEVRYVPAPEVTRRGSDPLDP